MGKRVVEMRCTDGGRSGGGSGMGEAVGFCLETLGQCLEHPWLLLVVPALPVLAWLDYRKRRGLGRTQR